MTNVLVTGGAGAIGGLVIRELLGNGHRPIVYSRTPNHRNIHDLSGHVDLAQGDVRDLARLREVIETFEVERIIHLAVLIAGPAENDPLMAVDVNVNGTATVLEAARIVGLRRVICAGSRAALGPLPRPFCFPTMTPVGEDQPANPSTVYGYTKYAAEILGKLYRDRFGMEVATLRMSVTWGPGWDAGRHGRYDKFVAEVIENSLSGRPTKVVYDPAAPDDYFYNGNNAAAMVQACFAPALPHHVYHVGSGVKTTLAQMLAAVCEALPATGLLGPTDEALIRPHDPTAGVLDTRRAQCEWGFRTVYDLPESIRHCIRIVQVIRSAEEEVG